MTLFTKDQIELLRTHYSTMGSELCSEKLGGALTAKQIRRKANKLGLKVTAKIKSEIQKKNVAKRPPKSLESYRVDATRFFNIQEKEAAYILGLLWADGYFLQRDWRITLELVLEDIMEIKDLFDLFGKWSFYIRTRKNRKRPIGNLTTTHKPLYEFLAQFDYEEKSTMSGHKILHYIKPELHLYWWRGYFDGDGCFYHNNNQYCNQMSFSGSYSQDWTFVKNLLTDLGITKYTIRQQITFKKNKYSIVRISNKKDIIAFGDYIYTDYDGIGLSRKYKKFIEIKS